VIAYDGSGCPCQRPTRPTRLAGSSDWNLQ
jgi:hypothetical protein